MATNITLDIGLFSTKATVTGDTQMKYKYLIVMLADATCYGTDDSDITKDLITNEDILIIDLENSTTLFDAEVYPIEDYYGSIIP